MQQLEEVVGQAKAEIEGVSDIAALDEIRVKYLGKKGFFTEQMKGLGALSAEERPAAGAVINQAKQQVQDALNARREALEVAVLNQKLAAETIDVSLPGRRIENGGLHPVTRTIERIERLAPQVMRDHGMTKPICANIDLYTGFIYKMLGVPETLFTPLFAVARMAGWSAHRMEELFCAHRIIRPAYRPVIDPLEYKPLADR